MNLRSLALRVYNVRALAAVRPIAKLIRYLPDPILIYQVGKVGSSTVLESLRAADVPVFHVHNINRANRDRIRRIYEEHDARLPAFFHEGRILRYWLRWSRRRKRIITLVRDPIARQISMEFQTGEVRGFPIDDADDALRILRRKLLEGDELDEMYSWFDREIRQTIGVDVFDHPFDRERGFARIVTPEADILVMTLERMGSLRSELCEFVGREVQLIRSNVESSEVYARVKNEFRLSEQEVRSIYDNDWMRHFYSRDDISRFIERWSESTGASHSARPGDSPARR